MKINLTKVPTFLKDVTILNLFFLYQIHVVMICGYHKDSTRNKIMHSNNDGEDTVSIHYSVP